MALTTAGAVLTDRHRRRQIATTIAADSEIRRAMRMLELDDIDRNRTAWQQRMVGIVAKYHRVSEVQAADYLARYRLAELGTAGGPIATAGLDTRIALEVIDAAGPQALKRRIGKGFDLREALQITSNEVAAETRKLILAGGRGTVRESARRDRRAIGWRRKSDGDPCTFCAMLVSRGPAYTEEAAALAKGNGDPYHDHCACTVEVVYGDWIPTETEQRFVDSYFEAAEAATEAGLPRTAPNVLATMRTNGTFRDSPVRRAVAR